MLRGSAASGASGEQHCERARGLQRASQPNTRGNLLIMRRAMMMYLTASIPFVLLSTSASAVACVNCNNKFSGPWGLQRSTRGYRGTQERAMEDSGRGMQQGATEDGDESYRTKGTEFSGWWRGVKRHPTSSTKRATGDSGRPTGGGETKCYSSSRVCFEPFKPPVALISCRLLRRGARCHMFC